QKGRYGKRKTLHVEIYCTRAAVSACLGEVSRREISVDHGLNWRLGREFPWECRYLPVFSGAMPRGASDTSLRIRSDGTFAVSTTRSLFCEILMLFIARWKSGSGPCPETETSADSKIFKKVLACRLSCCADEASFVKASARK